MTGKRIITFDELEAFGVRMSRKNLMRLERGGLFPKRVQIGPRRVGWVEKEIIEYIDACINSR